MYNAYIAVKNYFTNGQRQILSVDIIEVDLIGHWAGFGVVLTVHWRSFLAKTWQQSLPYQTSFCSFIL